MKCVSILNLMKHLVTNKSLEKLLRSFQEKIKGLKKVK